MNKNEEKISFSQEMQLNVRKTRPAFPVDMVDWERLRRMITNYSPSSSTWENIAFAGISASLSIFLTWLTVINELTYPYKTHLLIAGSVTATVGVMSWFFSRSKKKDEAFSKSQIIQEMDTMQVTPLEEVEELSDSIQAWNATPQANVSQGVDFKDIPLRGSLLRSLTFKISSSSPFWRAGVKLSVPNEEGMPKLLTPKSFLFHMAVSDEKGVGLWIYHDGNAKPTVVKQLPQIASTQAITITIERNENNYVRCYVNDSLEYNLRFNPELFKKAYLAAWGDGNEYQVRFEDIVYKVD